MAPLRNTLLAVALAGLAACSAAPPLDTGTGESMKAIVYRAYGGPDVLRLETIDRPTPAGKQVLVKVHAAAANPLDWHLIRGRPHLMRLELGLLAPVEPRLGRDLAGEIVAVGADVTRFKPGDLVFGIGPSAFAEYSLAAERRLARKPDAISFAEAAAVPIAGATALQALRDQGKVRPGQKVLINGASGGVGTYMVQLAKVLGAEVTAVCSSRNVELVRSLGADHVIDYTHEDFTQGPGRYDVVVDNVGTRPLADLRRVLTPAGTLVRVGGGGPDHHVWGIGYVLGMAGRKAAGWFTDQRLVGFYSEVLAADLEYLAGLMTEGKLKSVIDRRYALAETAAAIGYIETGRARGKVVIDTTGQ